VAKIDYAKAKRRDQARLATFELRKRDELGRSYSTDRRDALASYAADYDLHCFKCGRSDRPWAKTKIEPDGRRWAICRECVDPNKRKQPKSG
jgi:hypothetical protein